MKLIVIIDFNSSYHNEMFQSQVFLEKIEWLKLVSIKYVAIDIKK
jgi:hypothetical protein